MMGGGGIISGIQDSFRIQKPINIIHYTGLKKKKNHGIILTDTEKAIHKIQHPFRIKTLDKLGIEGTLLNLIKDSYKNLPLTSDIMMKD